jgi:protein phosphatase
MHTPATDSATATLNVFVGSATHVGQVRDHNEDALHVPPPPALDSKEVADKGLLLVVCDGVGGLQAGEVASSIAARVAFDAFYANPTPQRNEALQGAVQVAHEAIRKAQTQHRAEMASTIVMALIHNGQVCVANVGDSRCYLLRAGQLRLLSTDHSWVNVQVRAGVLTADEARASNYQNVLTRILGGNTGRVEAELAYADWVAGDKLLLCSDGVWNMVSDSAIAEILTRAGANAQAAADALVQSANDAGGKDNITAIAVFDPSQPTAIVRARRPAWVLPALMAGLALIALVLVAVALQSAQRSTQASGAATGFTPQPTFVAPQATATRLPEVTTIATAQLDLVTATPLGQTGTPAQTPSNSAANAAPVATVTKEPVQIRFCRAPKNGQCDTSEPEFVIRRERAVDVDAVGVWQFTDLPDTDKIVMQWSIDGKPRDPIICTLVDKQCTEPDILPTQSRIQTTAFGAYRLDVMVNERIVLTGSFKVVSRLS